MRNLSRLSLAVLLCFSAGTAFHSQAAEKSALPADGSVLPFPPVPSASITKPRLQDSKHQCRAEAQHLKLGAPNVRLNP
jgi:hypothetical protein